MKVALTLWNHDLRSVLRDRTVAVLVFLPFVFAAFLRFAFPRVVEKVPVVAGYETVALTLFCLLAGSFPAFMLAFVLLEERDDGLFPAFRVLPIEPARFLGLRLSMVAVLGMLYPLMIMSGSNLVDYSLPTALVLAMLCGLQAPVFALVILALASNKIEGLAVIKGLFPTLLLPMGGVVLPTWWAQLFAVFPAYWIYLGFAAADGSAFLRACLGGLVMHGVVFGLFYRKLRRSGWG